MTKTIEIWNYGALLWTGKAENFATAREAMWLTHPLYRSMSTQARIVDPARPDTLSVHPGEIA